MNDIEQTFNSYFDYDGMLTIQNNKISIKGNCRLKRQVERLPVKFSSVTGNFIIDNNNILSLEGSPIYVGGVFSCNNNKLTSLEGMSTKIVGGDFWCSNNKLTSLKGSPLVYGRYDCGDNNLSSLQGLPSTATGVFCSNNNLTILDSIPTHLRGDFWCNNNKLTSLKGSPPIVDGYFCCYDNKLLSLNGIPKKINGEFRISVGSNTPLLKILDVIGITSFGFYKEGKDGNHIPILVNLFKEHYGKKNAIMKVGLEMIRLGYGSNARL